MGCRKKNVGIQEETTPKNWFFLPLLLDLLPAIPYFFYEKINFSSKVIFLILKFGSRFSNYI